MLVAALVISGSATTAVLSLAGRASQPLSGRVPARSDRSAQGCV